MPDAIANNTRTFRAKEIASILKISVHTLYKIIKQDNIPVIQQGNRKLLPSDSIRKIFESRGFVYKKEGQNKPLVINLSCMKGGVGKTTLATALADASSRIGFRVLVLDLDMQANITESFNKKSTENLVMHNIMTEEKTVKDVIINVTSNLDLIPSSLENSKSDFFLSSSTVDTPSYFSTLLEDCYSDYDLIIIDCPPTVNKITTCAYFFSDINLVPINADIDSYHGAQMSVAHANSINKKFKTSDNIDCKIIFNKYDAREKLSMKILGMIASDLELNECLLDVVVRTDTAFKNTKISHTSIFDLAKSSGKDDCLNLMCELTGINDWADSEENKYESKKNSLTAETV